MRFLAFLPCWTDHRFVNRDDVDFGLAHDLPAVQTLEMVRDSGGVEVSGYHVIMHARTRKYATDLTLSQSRGRECLSILHIQDLEPLDSEKYQK